MKKQTLMTTNCSFVKTPKMNRLFIMLWLILPMLFSNCYKVTIYEKYIAPIVNNILITSIEIKDQSRNTGSTMYSGSTLQLVATILPNNATNKSVLWTSSNELVATVDQTGLVTPLLPAIEGSSTTITATTQDGSNLSAQYIVTITMTRIPVTSITITNPPTTYTLGDPTLSVPNIEYSPADANDGKTITWGIDNVNSATIGATIDANTGILDWSAVSTIGNIIITATTANGITASYTIRVNYATITAITIEDENHSQTTTITFGDALNKQLTAIFNPYTDPNTGVTWASDNNLVEVDQTGKVTFASGAINPSTDVSITITATNGTISGTYTVTVKPKTRTLTLINKTSQGGTMEVYSNNTYTTKITDLTAIPEGTTVYLKANFENTDLEVYSLAGADNLFTQGDATAQVLMNNDKTITYSFATQGTLFNVDPAKKYNIIGYLGTATGVVIIPEKINGTTISGIIAATTPVFKDKTNITSVSFISPNNITSIGIQTFQGCTNLTSVDIENTKIKIISNYTFYECTSLTNINIPEGVTSIGTFAFYGCSNLISATLPNTLQTIATESFENCNKLSSIIIPDNVTSVGAKSFAFCSGLTRVTIGSSVTNIGNNAFSNCSNLTSITIKAITPPTLGTNVFISTPLPPALLQIYVPTASITNYKGATTWSTYTSKIVDGGF